MSRRRSLVPVLAVSLAGCGNLLGLDDLEYRDPSAAGGTAGTAGTAGGAGAAGTAFEVCDPGPSAIPADDAPPIEVPFESEPVLGERVNAATFGTPRVRLTDSSDGTECFPAVPEPLSPNAKRVAYVCDIGPFEELRVLDLADDMTPTVRITIPPLPGGSVPKAEALWDGDDAIFVHDGRLLARFDLAASSHAVIEDFTPSLSGAELESMTASDDRQLFAFVARLENSTSYFTWARQSGERTVFPFEGQLVTLAPSGSHLIAYENAGTRVHDLAAATLDGILLGTGPPDFGPDQAIGVISGDAFVAGVSDDPPFGPIPTILSRKLATPNQFQSLIAFPAGSEGVVHLGASSALPGWVAVSRVNASSSALSGEVFLLSHEHTMRRLARHSWGAAVPRPTPYLSKNACALVHPSNWGTPTTHLYLLDLR